MSQDSNRVFVTVTVTPKTQALLKEMSVNLDLSQGKVVDSAIEQMNPEKVVKPARPDLLRVFFEQDGVSVLDRVFKL